MLRAAARQHRLAAVRCWPRSLSGREGVQPTGHSILVVDDESAIRQLLEDLLSSEGHDVTSAADGEQALSRLRDGVSPCVIVLDLMMPRLNGWQLAAVLRDDPAFRRIPILVTSANPAYAAEVERIGASRWLPKPIDVDALLAAVDELCLAA